MYTTLRQNYIAKIPKTCVFQVATNGSEAWTLERTALTKTNAFRSKLWEIAKNSLHRNTKKKSTRGASSVRTLACTLCKETKGETFWPPEMTRRARGRLNKKTDKWGKKRKREAEDRKKKNIQELFRQWAEMQLSYNFTWTIKPSDHPKFFFISHTNYILPCSIFL